MSRPKGPDRFCTMQLACDGAPIARGVKHDACGPCRERAARRAKAQALKGADLKLSAAERRAR